MDTISRIPLLGIVPGALYPRPAGSVFLSLCFKLNRDIVWSPVWIERCAFPFQYLRGGRTALCHECYAVFADYRLTANGFTIRDQLFAKFVPVDVNGVLVAAFHWPGLNRTVGYD